MPFCVDEFCVACSATVDANAACSEFDQGLPLCVEDTCVQCSAEDTSVCVGTTPLCDVDANTCVPCEFHEQCQDIGRTACDIVSGACFLDDQVLNVDVDDDVGLNDPIQEAIDLIPPGGVRALYLTGTTDPSVELLIDEGKRIALISSSTNISLRGFDGGPTLRVHGADTVAYLHRVVVRGNGANVGISVESSAAFFADSTQVYQNSGGLTLAEGTSGQLRNSMIGLNGNQFAPTTGINSAGELTVLYSSIIANDGDAEDSLQCSGGSTEVRNSIFIGSSPASVNCSGLTSTNSAFDEAVPGAGNSNVGNLVPGWFDSVAAADFQLTPAGQAQFSDIALWQTGDPPFDFQGDPRPSVNGTPDFPGADTIP
jgi:hypothetical protein